jgi:hypothetical protein
MKVFLPLICRSVLLAGGWALALPAAAASVEFGDASLKIDTTVSLGATFRMQERSAELIGITNGGTARSVNDDDGNLGFEGGDVVSAVAKATHDVDLRYRDFGLFSRFSYFYDDTAAGAAVREDRFDAGGLATADRAANSYELGERGRDRLESEIDLLDLFAYGRFDIGDRTLSARFGRQVVSWGESTFIGNSINSINPIDVSRIRVPGAEIKEALIPTSMLWLSMPVTGGLSAEAVWLTSYRRTEIDPRGSFFSTSDIASDDGNKAIVTFGRRKDDNHITTSPAADPAATVWVPREIDADVEDPEKQYGVALRYYAEALGDTELGLYYLTYHSRTPLISAVRGGGSAPGGGTTNSLNAAAPTCSQNASDANCRASYFIEYPDNIELIGLSFNTSGPAGIALQGEYSFRPNQPVQISGTEILLATLGLTNTVTGQGTFDHDSDANTPEIPVAFTVPRGTVIRGYDEVDMHQVQLTLTKAFGPTLAAQQFVTLGEIGYNRLDLRDGQVYSAPGAALPAPGSGRGTSAQPDGAAAGGSVQREGFLDRSSWGYRLVARMDFESVLGPAGLSPRLVWAHDVNGVGPNFNQDAQAATVGVTLNYLQQWQADIGYTLFTGGRTYEGSDLIPPPAGQPTSFATGANPSRDRDFLAISVSYAF